MCGVTAIEWSHGCRAMVVLEWDASNEDSVIFDCNDSCSYRFIQYNTEARSHVNMASYPKFRGNTVGRQSIC